MVPNTIYVLCAITSILCAVLLVRGYRQTRARLLFWSAWCFVGLAINNALLIVDMRVLPDYDLHIWRTVPAVIGAAMLVYGLIWESAR